MWSRLDITVKYARNIAGPEMLSGPTNTVHITTLLPMFSKCLSTLNKIVQVLTNLSQELRKGT